LEYGITLERQKLDIPEIQAMNTKDIVEHSLKVAFEQIQKPVVVTDTGYYIRALGGFPGPYVKWINNMLKPEQILAMMDGIENREVEIVEYLGYCDGDGTTHLFENKEIATVSLTVSHQPGNTFDRILIREGMDTIQADTPNGVIQEFFKKKLMIWHDFAKALV
jgi:non-canonical purine NTP pyrophosphatase (RdgB/HAM1 family)